MAVGKMLQNGLKILKDIGIFNNMKDAKFNMKTNQIKKGDFYLDCNYHPCLCISKKGDDIQGISLVDGSMPRGCSINNCGPDKISVNQAIKIRIHGVTNKYKRLHAESPEIIEVCGLPW